MMRHAPPPSFLFVALLLLLSVVPCVWCDDNDSYHHHQAPRVVEHHNNNHLTSSISASTLSTTSSKHVQQEREPRIVGGTKAKRNAYPYFVRIDNVNGTKGICGGVLVARNLVLTAGHCYKRNLKVVVNAYTRIAPRTTRNNKNNKNKNQQQRRRQQKQKQQQRRPTAAIRRQVASVRIHPNYNRTTWNNDVMLLKLKSPIPTGRGIVPVRKLNFNATIPQVGDPLTAIGMGRMVETGNLSFVLRDVIIPTSDVRTCIEAYKRIGRTVSPDNMLCAGTIGKSPCKGDSGGPLLSITDRKMNNNRTTTTATLVGIISWGAGCGRPNYPSIHTRISGVQDWLRPTICNMTRYRPSWCPKRNVTTIGGDDDDDDNRPTPTMSTTSTTPPSSSLAPRSLPTAPPVVSRRPSSSVPPTTPTAGRPGTAMSQQPPRMPIAGQRGTSSPPTMRRKMTLPPTRRSNKMTSPPSPSPKARTTTTTSAKSAASPKTRRDPTSNKGASEDERERRPRPRGLRRNATVT